MDTLQKKKADKLCFQMFAKLNGERYKLPLKHQKVAVKVMNTIATIDIIQTYSNDTTDPLEITLNVPIEKDYGMGKLTIQIDDNLIEGKILEKEKAKEKYDDALASGHTAVIAQEDENEKEDTIKLIIGNLLPGQEAQVHMQLINVLKIEAAAYTFRVPVQYFPNYNEDRFQYNYEFVVNLHSDIPITYVSYPTQAHLAQQTQDENRMHIRIEKTEKSCLGIDRDLVVYYRTNDMESTVLYAQESPQHPDQVATMMTFVPSFVQKVSDEKTELEAVEDEMPDPQDVQTLTDGNSLFIFLVDRSGSMSGSKMKTTNDALILFLKSLPVGSYFEIISFGSNYVSLSHLAGGYENNDQNLNSAIQQVQRFGADMGGTEIFQPLQHAIQNIQTQLNKRIFMLTDGEVSNPQKVQELAAQCPFDIRIHTIGIGRDCDVRLVQSVAKAGRGSCSLVPENSNLKSIVIQALTRAQDPSYSNCKVNYSSSSIILANNMNYIFNPQESGYELFANEMFISVSLMSKQDFESLKLKITSDKHQTNGKQLEKLYEASDFKRMDDGDELFKVAARMRILQVQESNQMGISSKDQEVKKVSLTYQVLSKQTAFLAISKNDNQSLGELKSVEAIQPIQNNFQDYDQMSNLQSFSYAQQSCALGQAQYISLQSRAMSSTKRKGGFSVGSAISNFFGKAISSLKPNDKKQKKQSQQPSSNSKIQQFSLNDSKSSSKEEKKRSDVAQQRSFPFASASMSYTSAQDTKHFPQEFTNSVLLMDEIQDNIDEEQWEGFSFEPAAQSQHPNINSNYQQYEESRMMPSSDSLKQESDTLFTGLSIDKPDAIQKIKKLLPKMDDLILAQSSTGQWASSAVIEQFISQIEWATNQAVIDEVKAMLADQSKFNEVWNTLLALFILSAKFKNKQSEWALIAQKAKQFLKSQGIPKPDNITKKLNFVI
eukprot:403366571